MSDFDAVSVSPRIHKYTQICVNVYVRPRRRCASQKEKSFVLSIIVPCLLLPFLLLSFSQLPHSSLSSSVCTLHLYVPHILPTLLDSFFGLSRSPLESRLHACTQAYGWFIFSMRKNFRAFIDPLSTSENRNLSLNHSYYTARNTNHMRHCSTQDTTEYSSSS